MAAPDQEKLAIEGGPKAVKGPLPHWPSFSEEAIKAVEQVLRSGKVNYWTGKLGMEFERRFAAWQGSKYAISTTNGTAALHTALSALGTKIGIEIRGKAIEAVVVKTPFYKRAK